MISVLICSYNAERFITDTIVSVLSQTYRDIEILILDNCSTDKTRQILKEFQTKDNRITIFFGKDNMGPYAGLNYLLDKAKGEFIAINDHDDIWYPEKLDKQVQFLKKNEKYVGCGSAIINWYEKYNTYFYRSHPKNADVAWHTSLLFKNNGYRYDLTKKVATDFYFIKNILSQNTKKIYNFPEPFVLRRVFKESNNLSGKWMKSISFLEILILNVGFIDKLTILFRKIFPKEFIELIVNRFWKNNIPKIYQIYVSAYKIS